MSVNTTEFYQRVHSLISSYLLDDRVQAVQFLVQKYGPIPNEWGDKFRTLLSPMEIDNRQEEID